MNMSVDFPLILTLAVLITGAIFLIDFIFLAKKRKKKGKKRPGLIRYSREFFPILLVVLLIRSFLFQPYHVPTGSLEPTVIPGDFIAVNQFAYENEEYLQSHQAQSSRLPCPGHPVRHGRNPRRQRTPDRRSDRVGHGQARP